MKQTLKITISPTKLKGIAYNLHQKQMPHSPSHMENEGGACKGLMTTIKKGIVITNLTKKKPHPSSPLERMGGVIIIISEVNGYVTFINMCINILITLFCFGNGGAKTTFSWFTIIKIVISKSIST
jgi:hypothetical protein